MSEEMIVRYCSPTLAGIKTGSLFSAAFASKREQVETLRSWNHLLCQKGLRAVPFGCGNGRTAVYVYRVSRLGTDLQKAAVRNILGKRGYDCDRPERCIARLAQKLKSGVEFPHEIGLFLGYPPEDVSGFINKEKCKLTGAWKVYGDKTRAEKLFAQYKKCTQIYSELFHSGRSVERLTVAG